MMSSVNFRMIGWQRELHAGPAPVHQTGATPAVSGASGPLRAEQGVGGDGPRREQPFSLAGAHDG